MLERLVVDSDFHPEVGFLRRRDFRKWGGTARFGPRPRIVRSVRKYLFEGALGYVENTAGIVESRQVEGAFGLDLNNGDGLRVVGGRAYEFLARPFSIDGSITIPPGGYSFTNAMLQYTLGAQRRFAVPCAWSAGASMAAPRRRQA
jgi:hypothetical protein